MKRITVLLCLILACTVISCGKSSTTPPPGSAGGLAILTIDKDFKDLPVWEWKELQRVLGWMHNDLRDELKGSGYVVTPIKDIKDYSSNMGKLLIVNIEHFYGGPVVRRPRGVVNQGLASLELSYKYLDSRGALLSSWQDGVNSMRGGTYCAEVLNNRAFEKLAMSSTMN